MARYRLLLVLAVGVAVVLIAAITLTPIATAIAVKFWIERAAGQRGLVVALRGIEAPLLRPVVIHELRIRRPDGKTLDLEISRAELDLRISAALTSSPKRLLRDLQLEGIRGRIENTGATANATSDWQVFQRLLADKFSLTIPQLVIRTRGIEITLRDAAISANELESGTCRAAQLGIVTGGFTKTFADLRGATSWEEDRLTIGAISLMRGLDLDVLTFDLAHLATERLAMDAALDVFGGKLRVSTSVGNSAGQRIWDLAGSATEVSLARMSDALQFSSRASGSIHACKFTFRGSGSELANATASVWTEITGLTWRDRTADTVMLGASLYSRQVQIEQLYVKQRKNELTLSGESALPRAAGELPDFRGDLSAAIGDLGDFARLLGWSASDFAGQLAVNGSVTERQRSLSGDLTVSGNSLTIFGAAVETLEARFALDAAHLQLLRCELRRPADGSNPIVFRAEADFSNTNSVSLETAFEQPLVVAGALPQCVNGIRLGDSPVDAAQLFSFTRLAAQGPLLRAGWTLFFDRDAGNSTSSPGQITLPFCGAGEERGDALVIAATPP